MLVPTKLKKTFLFQKVMILMKYDEKIKHQPK